MMAGYPITLDLSGRLCVVVGGGSVGRRKAEGLLTAGATVRVVGPDIEPQQWPQQVELRIREFVEDDLDGALLVFAATNASEVNAAVARGAQQRGILVNVADAPQTGDFVLPAVARHGSFTVSVSSDGRSPALACVLRDHLAEKIGEEWQVFLEIASAIRQKRLTLALKTEYNQGVLRRLWVDENLSELIARQDEKAIDQLLLTLFGEGFSLVDLGVSLKRGLT